MSTKDDSDRIALLQGTLDLLILRTLLLGPLHGHDIVKAIARDSETVLQVEQGSLYPALHRLIKRCWITYRTRHVGKQPAGEVLSADAEGTQTARRRDDEVGKAGASGRAYPEARMKPRRLDGLTSELRDHIERETRDNIERGMVPGEARRAALLAFGNVTSTQEDVRAVWIPVWLEHVVQDIRYAIRSVVRHPIFSVIVVATLAVGIGLGTAVSALYHSILLRPLDYPGAERLVSLTVTDPGSPTDLDVATNHEYWAWREQASSLDKLVAYTSYDQTLSAGGAATRVRVAAVTDDFWPMSGPRMIAGRLPAPDERNAAVVSEDLYTSTFSGEPGVLGQTVGLDRTQVTIVGVVSRGFHFQLPVPMRPGMQAKNIDVFRSLTVARPNPTFAALISIAGRLKSGVDIGTARAQLASINVERPFSDRHPGGNLTTLLVEPLAARLVRHSRVALNVLLAAVAFVLLVACANIANLLLARATVRQKEIAVRVSVGAGLARVFRQFLFESAIYSAGGGLIGFLIARWGLTAIIVAYPQAAPRLTEAVIHGRVIAGMIGILIATTFVFGFTPALAVQRSNVHDILKDGTKSATSPRNGLRARTILVGTQLALAVCLLTGAGLMVKSFWRMNERPPGFDPEHILTLRVDFAPGVTAQGAMNNLAKIDYTRRVLARVQAVPGVTAVSLNSHGDLLSGIDVEGTPRPVPGTTPPVYMNQTSPEFAGVMGLRLLSGRWFTADESQPVVVLNETLAKLKFGNEDPVGRHVEGTAIGEPPVDPNHPVPTTATVVGVVADLRYTKLDDETTPEYYVPYDKTRSLYRISLVIKTAGDPLRVMPSIRHVLAELDKTQAPFDIMRLDEALSDSIAPRRLNLIVLVTFALTSLLLALVGVYGVMSYSVSQRTHEIGIRSALGAARTDVIRMIVWQGLRVTAIGIGIGVSGALALTRVMSSLLFEVEPTDPLTFLIAATVLALSAVLASAVPAFKAGAVDPLVALRYE